MSAVRWFVLILLVVLAAENVCGVNFLWTPTVFNDTGSTIADWNVAENWTPTGIPTTGDIAIFAATSNVSSISSTPVDIAGFRMDAGVNASFVSSFTVTGTVRLTDINATLVVFGDFSADTILMSIGTIETFTGFNVNGSFQWGAGAIFIRGEQATINSFIITGTTGLLVGDVIITSFGLFEDASRFFGPSNITIGSEATLFLSLITLNLMQFTPEDESYIINRGNITVQSPLSDTLSTVRFGITPPSDASGYAGEPAVRMQNFGDILITGSGFLEVSTYDQGSGSLVLAGYRMNQLGLRTIPNAVSSINGGIISGNGWIDSDVVMSPGTALYLSATSNFTVTRISMLGDALLQITYFDPGLHGILFTASFNSRTIVGGALRLVFGNGPNALIVAGSGFQVVDRDVRARVGDLILLVAPIQFTNPIPAATFISAEVENNKFTIEQVGVQFAITQSIQFWNVTDVECDNDCSDNGVCVYPTFFTKPYCECDASDVSLHADCSVVDWTFLAWIIGPSLFGLLMLIEIMFCCFEGKYRKQILSDPTSINYLRPEISAFRAVHRHAPVRRVCFDLASLFLFTTEYEGSARSFDILSKILLSTGAVAVGLLAIIPFKGTSSTLQPIFTGINAGLTFTIAAVQVGWSSKKPRKIEFDVEVDDKKINLWAPFQKENLGWILRALPLEMNRLYTPPIPYTVQDFMFQDQTLDLSMQLREYFANYYRLPKVLCTRGISTNPVVNTAPATPQPLHVPPPASANPSPQNSPSSLRPPSSTLAPIIVPPVPPPPPGHTSSTAYLPLP